MGQNTETQRRGSRPKTDPKPNGKGRGPNQTNNKGQGQSKAKNILRSNVMNTSNNTRGTSENRSRNNEKEPQNLEGGNNIESQNELRKSSNDTVISMEADDSVDENDHVFYSQYVSKMGENNQRRTSDTGAGQQHQDYTNLINYAPMTQFPPLPNREPTPKTTAVTREKSYSSACEKSKVSSTNDQTEAKGNINEQGQNGLDGGETRKKMMNS